MREGQGYLKRADSRIRLFCHRLTRRQRNIVTGMAPLLFVAACLYTILSAFSGSGEVRIEHIRPLGLQPGITTTHPNSDAYENGYPED